MIPLFNFLCQSTDGYKVKTFLHSRHRIEQPTFARIKMQKLMDIYATSCPREDNSSIVCLKLMYRDPPATWKPAIWADKAELTASNSENNVKRAILTLRALNHV